MPKSKTKGFREGTDGITTGDRMKIGDHRRHRSNCKYYPSYTNGICTKRSDNHCIGSAHCDDYDDGEEVFEIDTI